VPILVVAAAIVDDFDRPRRLLAARRSAPSDVAGCWEFPGGKVEPDEDVVVALHRELLEELGVSAELGPEVMPDFPGVWPLTGTATMRLWLARIVAGEPVPLEDHDELRWLPIGAWLSVPWLPADVAVVRTLERRFSEPG
jgi:8-oxo-dGTP diphosphatase